MSNKLSHEQAAVELRSFQAEPLEDYPGYRAPWRMRCLGCGDEVTSNLNYARRFGRSHKGCTANPRRTRKLPGEQAAEEMRSYGAEPLEPYPGIKEPWKCRCIRCHRTITPDLGHTRRYGRPCAGCPANPKRTRKLSDDVARAVMLAAGLVPLEPYTDSKTPWRCRCLSCGNEVTPTYNKVQQENHGCRHCGIARRAQAKMHDPEVMAAAYRALGGIPETSYPGVDEPWPGHCATCTRRLVRSWKKIKESGYFCTYCSGKRVIPEQAVATMVTAGCTPLEPYATSETPWRSQCHRCDRLITPTYGDVKAGQTPCAYCAHRLVDPAEARQVLIDAGVMPTVDYPGSQEPWPSVCSRCANEVSPIYNNVLKGHEPCRYCSGHRISTADAHALLAAADLEPLEDYRQATEVWRCRCTRCGSNTRTILTRLKFTGARGCPVCQIGGFRRHEPACVYLLHDPTRDVYKIGVTNQYEFRVREHRRYGLIPLLLDGHRSVWPVPIGEQALQAEDAVMRLWRVELRLPQALTPGEMPQNGATETARLGEVELRLTIDTILQNLRTDPGPLQDRFEQLPLT